jgi:transcriptional regulator with XRE-family HTH domain
MATTTPTTLAAPRTLREYLKVSGTRQLDLARKCGVHQSTISMLVHGLRAAGGKLARKLHKETGVPFEKLIIAEHRRPRR